MSFDEDYLCDLAFMESGNVLLNLPLPSTALENDKL